MYCMWMDRSFVRQVGDQPELYYDARSSNHQKQTKVPSRNYELYFSTVVIAPAIFVTIIIIIIWNYNEQGFSGVGKISSDNFEIFRNLWNAAFITAGNWSLSWVKWDQSAPYHISLRPILVLSRLCLRSSERSLLFTFSHPKPARISLLSLA